ncbi:FAD-binding oxidoreductase [Aureimonas psammosilenae]|uniref:FAD-binding oxidoreductase n=1 Tax=Aureimonas psammosilenae TaxID=2495496 RepID=UPI00126078D1|nr:FAD-binding oxidoreductase [Aureimonas psammosilenae]
MSDRGYPSWGRPARSDRQAVGLSGFDFAQAGTATVLPRGNGRSYGDTCLNDGGLLLDMRGEAEIYAFDPTTGILEADAGVTLDRITRLVAPSGWFLPVTPGTQFVTLGGAIANDVHGKNHHRRGTFGRWVESLVLHRSDREPLECDHANHSELFAATIGGLGLTGAIRRARIRLLRVPSLTIRQTVTRFERLADYFALAEEADAAHEYAVAWIDSFAKGRGHLIAGDHAEKGARDGIARPPLGRIPLTPPISPLAGLPLRLFNEAYFRKSPLGTTISEVPFDAFFYPLDRIGEWNRLYGPRGLHQHQSVLPFGTAEEGVRELLACASSHRQGSFLTVLKRFGDPPSPGLMSFPTAGYTLTLDFPDRGERTLRLLTALDAITVSAGGRVNPYKDARMSPETFAASFPQWRRLEALRDPAIMSDFWRRTAIRLPGSEKPERDDAQPEAFTLFRSAAE